MNVQANVSNAHRGAGDGPPVAVHASFAEEPRLGPLPEPGLLERLRASWSVEALIPALDRDRIEEPEWRPAGIVTFAIHAALIVGIIALSMLGIGRFVEKPTDRVAVWLQPDVRENPPPDDVGGGARSSDPGDGADGGGGSSHDVKPATGGAPPPMRVTPAIVPPMIAPPIKPPSLPVDASVQGPTYNPPTTDPVGIPAPPAPGDPSAGQNGGNGIGNGNGPGVGSGNGPGSGAGNGGPGGGRPNPNGGGPDGSGGPTVGPNGDGLGPGVANRALRLSYKAKPIPTQAMLDTGTFGTVTIRVTVGPDGRIVSYAPVQRLSNGGTQAAIDALLRCKFLPAIRNGQYVTETTMLVFNVTNK